MPPDPVPRPRPAPADAPAASAMPGTAPRASEVIIATQQEPSFVGVDFSYTGMTELVALLVTQPMTLPSVTFDDAWRYFPVAFEKIPRLEDGDWTIRPDGRMEVVWRLRRGLRWHDGTPLTVHDFAFAWHVIHHPRFPASTRDVAGRIEEILTPDPHTMVVRWKTRYAHANALPNGTGDFSHLPRHLLGGAFRADPAALVRTAWGTTAHTPSTGPYRIVEWNRGSSMTLERWDGFPHDAFPDGPYRSRPAVRRLTFRFLPDAAAVIEQVLSGEIDAFDETAIPFVDGLALERGLARDGRTDWVVTAEPGLVWEHVAVNTHDPRLADRRVRHALLHAVDREGLVRALFDGRQPVAHQWLPPRHYGHLADAPRHAFDVARANRLLDEAGWRRGAGGVRGTSGARLALTLSTTAGDRTRGAVAEILRRAWRAIGVDLAIRTHPVPEFINEVLPRRRFELAMCALVFGPTGGCEGVYTGDAIPGPDDPGRGQNFTGYANAEVTGLCHAIEEEPDAAARAAMLHRMTRRWLDDLPALPLYYRANYMGRKAALRGWRPTGTGRSAVTWNAPEWRWET